MRTFTTTMIATAAIWAQARAQLPRECFYVTDLHGPKDDTGDLMSSLPTLMAMYKPGMRMSGVTAMQDPFGQDIMTGIQADLVGHKYEQLQLPMVGTKTDDWDSQRIRFGAMQPDRMSIMVDKEEGGICDVVFYFGKDIHGKHTEQHLSKKLGAIECDPVVRGVTEIQLALPETTPLVGFHGVADHEGLESLGLIFVDTENPRCQKPLDHSQMEAYRTVDKWDLDETVEKAITQPEHQRAVALEAILVYNSMIKARQTKEELEAKIKQMEEKYPMKELVVTMQPDREDLKALFKDLDHLDQQQNPATKAELKDIFDRLTAFYDDDGFDEPAEYEIPVTVGMLSDIYEDLALIDGGDTGDFDGEKKTEFADVMDLQNFLMKVAFHYTKGADDYLGKLDSTENKRLSQIFQILADWYADEVDTKVEPSWKELYPIYDDLAEIFGSKTDFDLAEDEIDEIYNKISNNQKVDKKFEGSEISSYKDLVELKNHKKKQIVNKMEHKVKQETTKEEQAKSHLEKEYNMMDEELEEMLSGESQHNGSQTAEYFKKHEKKVDILAHEEQLLDESIFGKNTEQVTAQVDEEALKADMMKSFVGILVAAVIVSLAIGGICCLCAYKLYTRSKAQKLQKLGAQGLRFQTSGTVENLPTDPEKGTQNTQEPAETVRSTEAECGVKKNPKILSQMDTEDVKQAEERNQPMPEQMNTEGDFDDIGNQLTTRGLQFNKPMDRRSTVAKRGVMTEVKNNKAQF